MSSNSTRKYLSSKPYIYVFCEGESEQQYIKTLKTIFQESVVLIGYDHAQALAPGLLILVQPNAAILIDPGYHITSGKAFSIAHTGAQGIQDIGDLFH